MKKGLRLIGVIVLVMGLLLSSVAAAENEKVDEDKECIAYIGLPVVDGEIDDIWENAPEIVVETVKKNASLYYGDSSKVAGEDYGKLTCKTLWDPDSTTIFILYIVEDKTISLSAATDWERDSVELFLDYDNVRTGAKDGNSYQHRIYADESMQQDTADMTCKVKMTDNGYIVELSHKTPDTVKKGDYLGIDFQMNDDAEGNGKRHVCLGWSDSEDKASSDTRTWGQVLLSAEKADPNAGDTPAPAESTPEDPTPADETPADETPVASEPDETEDPTPVPSEPDEVESPKTYDNGAAIFMALMLLAAAAMLGIRKKALS